MIGTGVGGRGARARCRSLHEARQAERERERGDHGFEALDRHCTTREMKDEAIWWARESARMRWFYFDGIYLHYELDYPLVC